MTDKVDLPGGISGRASAPAAEEHPHMFGLTLAMALIAGSIIGVGIFNRSGQHHGVGLRDVHSHHLGP
jgi:hypothetical protein